MRLQDDVDRYALGQVEGNGFVGLAHAARDMGRDLHADRFGPAACGDQDRGVLGQAVQALQGARAAGFGGDHQAAGAVIVAQHDDAATAQFGQGALDGGQCSGGAGMELTWGHAFL